MKRYFKLSVVLIILLAILCTECKTRKDCGGRRKKKVMTQMGGYM